MSDDCLFCKVRDGEIPAKKLHEDDDVLAFDDINPQAPVHFLVIPKQHIATANELTAEHDAAVAKLLRIGAKLAKERGLGESGYRLVMNCQAGAGQSVFHIHLHVLGGRDMNWPPG